MRSFGKWAVAFGLVALMSSPAWAQGRGGFGGGPGGGGGAMLLGNKGVQAELKATDEQISKLDALAQELGGKAREKFQGIQDLPQDERGPKMQEIQKELQAEVNKSLADVLKPEQIKRFHQIQIQAAGVQAFHQPKVVETLKITDEQKGKIKEITDALQAEMTELRSTFQDDREGAMKKMTELRKTTFEKAAALLTADQKKAWGDLIGSPYEVKFERRPN